MRDAQKPDHISLTNLVSRLREGRFVIPDFQRGFVWGPSDINNLMRSIFLDYYIGSLLLWKGKTENFDALSCEPIYAFHGNDNREHIVLDGQQRFTAMYYAFMVPNAPAPKTRNRYLYFIQVDKFMVELYEDAFIYEPAQRNKNLINDPVKQYQDHKFPLSIIGQNLWELGNWVQGYVRYWNEKTRNAHEIANHAAEGQARQNAENARAFGKHLEGITQQYQVAYIELDRDLELDKICDIFTQINSRGIRLSIFDLFNALLRPKGLKLRHMWREAEQRLNFVKTDRMNVYVLQVMSILCQNYFSSRHLYHLLPGQERMVREPDRSCRREVLVPDTADFKRRWIQAVDSLEQTIKLLRHPQEFGVIASHYLPYSAIILPVFAALQIYAHTLPPSDQLDARCKIRHWYWASVFLQRYSSAPHTTSPRDFMEMKRWFDDDAAEPVFITEFPKRFRDTDLQRETRTTSAVYIGIFNLLVLKGARDWITGNVPQHDDLDDHHIVPKAWGKEKDLDAVDSVLNRTLLTGNTNRNVIGNRLPNEYLLKLIADNGEGTVREILESHLISPAAFDILRRDPFTPDDFEAFLSERQRTIQNAIENLLAKFSLDLPQSLRELDTQVEGAEIRLRQIIACKLQDDPSNLPSHVQKKTKDRLQQAAKKNPAIDPKAYQTLTAQLQYTDLRDLQDIIVTRALWQKFEDRFRSKEQVATRFDQLAELRNCIRHSRQVNKVTRKDGEAAILWFTHVLS